jgi:hypothetical protein
MGMGMVDRPDNKPDNLCMAPWTHTYLSPQTERRLCCASREPAKSFTQYIDTEAGTGKYNPTTLEQHWNSEHMRGVRRRMMAGEKLSECEVCTDKLLNTDVYRTYFWHLFQHRYDELWTSTDETGYTTMKPVSWDYRFSNLCNFKCRTCGDMLSSSWETEQRKHNMVSLDNPKNKWMRPDVRREITKFQDTQIEQEFSEAVEQHRVEEIYWVGGEPLMYEQHWRYMKRIVELGDGPWLYARYNTNLSRIKYKGIDLGEDILSNIRDWQICASLDGTGEIGEYIRTGLKYNEFVDNFRKLQPYSRNKRMMRLDYTLTLPGMQDVSQMQALADELDVDILAKVIFTFTPDIIMSPLALPRDLLDRKVDSIVNKFILGDALRNVLLQLKNRPNIEETYGKDDYERGMRKGKRRVLTLENIRPNALCMRDIFAGEQGCDETLEWWDNIDAG